MGSIDKKDISPKCGEKSHLYKTALTNKIALAEQLTTIPKDDLQFLLGSLAKSEKMLELEQAMKQQLEVA